MSRAMLNIALCLKALLDTVTVHCVALLDTVIGAECIATTVQDHMHCWTLCSAHQGDWFKKTHTFRLFVTIPLAVMPVNRLHF